MCMLRPVRPQPSTSDGEAEELCSPDDEAPLSPDGEAPQDNDGWDEALDVVAHEDVQETADDDNICKPCRPAADEVDGEREPIQLAQRPVPLTGVNMPSEQGRRGTT